MNPTRQLISPGGTVIACQWNAHHQHALSTFDLGGLLVGSGLVSSFHVRGEILGGARSDHPMAQWTRLNNRRNEIPHIHSAANGIRFVVQ